MDITLVMFTEKGERRDFRITKSRAVIGRNTECEIQIPLSMVSRRHCELILKKDKVAVRDLGSSNGTYVNNQRIQESDIAAGETLTVGPVVFTLLVDGMPKNVKPILTLLHRPKKPAAPKPPTVGQDDTGTVDLDGSGKLEILANDSTGSGMPAELKEPTQ
jgi:pSer/pThr/pTyr-binding forkhead associated (FHA) protein